MARQKCVMNAMLQQLDPKKVLTNFGDIAKAGKQIISTSIPASELDTFINLSLKTKNLPVSSVSFVPPAINTGDPDWDKIRDDGRRRRSTSPRRRRRRRQTAAGKPKKKANGQARRERQRSEATSRLPAERRNRY